MVEKWIQKAHPKKGLLHKELGIPIEQKIPINVLEKIVDAKEGAVVSVGKKKVKVTGRLKHQSNFALTMKRL